MLERFAEQALGGIFVRARSAAGEMGGELASGVGVEAPALVVEQPATRVVTVDGHRA